VAIHRMNESVFRQAAGSELLIDRAGPIGNVGHPTGFDGNKHLRKM
jgi:hypothetical protein